MFNFLKPKVSVNLQPKPDNERGQGPREMPIWREPEGPGRGRFVSCRKMHQIRLRILKRLADRMRDELSPSPQG